MLSLPRSLSLVAEMLKCSTCSGCAIIQLSEIIRKIQLLKLSVLDPAPFVSCRGLHSAPTPAQTSKGLSSLLLGPTTANPSTSAGLHGFLPQKLSINTKPCPAQTSDHNLSNLKKITNGLIFFFFFNL